MLGSKMAELGSKMAKLGSTILEKSYRTAGDTVDLWEIKMDKMHIMIRFSI